ASAGRRVAWTGVRPLIGISSYGRAGERQVFSLPCEYVDVVRLAGGVTVVLPAVEGEIPEALESIHGLILPGGGDIDPAHYGGVRHDANYGISPERDGFEMQLTRAALARPDLPVLCICRGMQLLNVALGGDLVAHIPDRYGEQVMHRRPERMPVEHEVRIDPTSRIGALLGTEQLIVQSVHHQAVGRLGQGLRAVARSPVADGANTVPATAARGPARNTDAVLAPRSKRTRSARSGAPAPSWARGASTIRSSTPIRHASTQTRRPFGAMRIARAV